ncbi:glycosyltransferase [Sphaerimonospora cavernae]|uniref:4,4'-diaponeurosporenoate glycosyltransferase n=1 Tax=Sphaerimonospora cavernae TaxID=1740611 RepID=A0ABV6U6V1_9ACTN
MALPIVSIVVPAHNEEGVLAANLSRLREGTAPGEFDIVVVANACTDRTAEVARDAGVRVVETATPGKANALRLGDRDCRTFPRIYLDADVELTATSVYALVGAAARPGALACAPVPRWDLADAGPVARRVHKVHDLLVAPSRGLAGVGAYVLTEQGHARVFPIPDVISDDGLVHRTFAPADRTVVAEARTLVRPAATVRAHLRRRIRVRQGNRQLDAMGLPLHEGRLGLRSLVGLVIRGKASPLDAGCYLAVLVLDRALTRLRALTRSRTVHGDWAHGDWGTDTGSRRKADR